MHFYWKNKMDLGKKDLAQIISLLWKNFSKNVVNNLETHVIFIDFKNAFDRFDQERLLINIDYMGYSPHLIKNIKSLYIYIYILYICINFHCFRRWI